MISPYQKNLENYCILKDTKHKCSENLGLDRFKKPKNLSSSASGMVFGIGYHSNIQIFIKFFPMKSNYYWINIKNKLVRRKKVDLDNNAMEIGITKYLSNILFQENPCTQNLVAVYWTKTCKIGYESYISMSTGEELPLKSTYLVTKDKSEFPQQILMSQYLNRQWDDQINYIFVEFCDGDLQSLFAKLTNDFKILILSSINLNKILNSIFMQISITLFILNDKLKGFYHNDLGLRNVLYKINLIKNSYFKYNINGETFLIENTGYVPKLWDFSYVYLHDENIKVFKESDCFDYLREEDEFISPINEPIPCLPQLCQNFMSFEDSFNKIKDTEMGKKIIEISKLKKDDYQLYFKLFNTFVPEDTIHRKLEPIFNHP